MGTNIETYTETREHLVVGISACLLGREVRYDGRQKRESALADIMARTVTFVPLCPEVEIGLGVPRESIELTEIRESDQVVEASVGADHAHGIRLLGVRSGVDHTNDMRAFSAGKLGELEDLGICGYVFKSRSPSCGVSEVPVFDAGGRATPRGRGLFADALMKRFPDMPVAEEIAMRDAGERGAFLLRVSAYSRLRTLFDDQFSVGRLVAFHSREKMLLLAHHEFSYRRLGSLVARASEVPVPELRHAYRSLFMGALSHRPTRGVTEHGI